MSSSFAIEPPLDLPIPFIRKRRVSVYVAPLIGAAAAIVIAWCCS